MIISNFEDISRYISNEDIFVSPILKSPHIHPVLNEVVAIYVSVIGTNCYFIVPIDHPEGLNLQKDHVQNLLNTSSKIFVLNKKEYMYFFNPKNVYDLHFIDCEQNEDLNISCESSYSTWMNRKHSNYSDINKIIPLVKLLEQYNTQYKLIEPYIKKAQTSSFNLFFNNMASPVFYMIEQHGLKILYKPFLELFKPTNLELNTKDNITYTSYNLYNITSRPTNAFNGVNYAAIPKKDDYRQCFIPQNDIFVEFDFDGYHIRLLAEQVGFSLTSEPAHTQLARLYFNKQDISQEEYIKSKQINFQALYGHTPDEHKNFELFKKIEDWSEVLWKEFTSKGYIETPISNKRFYNNKEGMYPKKLLNYIIQSLETARNISVLKNVLHFLDNKKTKITLYTYDSVLVDFNKADGKETLEELESILSENNKYPVKFKYSNNLVFD